MPHWAKSPSTLRTWTSPLHLTPDLRNVVSEGHKVEFQLTLESCRKFGADGINQCLKGGFELVL